MKIIGTEKALKVTVNLNRNSGGSMRITIEDDSSMCIIAEVEVEGGENIANLFTGRQCDGAAKVFLDGSKLWGMRMENKEVMVSIGDGWDDKTASKACDDAEKANPGWKADEYCRKWNSHKRSRDGYTVTLRRWVAP